MSDKLTTMDQYSLPRKLAQLSDRIQRIERMLQGQQVGTARIANISADKITTGTLVIRDGTDGAQLVVEDALGNEIVTLNTDGIIVEGGNIIIKNENGDVTFDANGLVSQQNFPSFDAFDNSSRTSSSTSLVDISGTTLNITEQTRTVKVLIFFTIMWIVTHGSPYQAQFGVSLAVDGSAQAEGFLAELVDDGQQYFHTSTTHLLVEMGAGTHTVKAQWGLTVFSGGTPQMTAFQTNITAVILGT